MSGITLVTLPIGNNEDLTPRARKTIEISEFIYAEDTRVFREFCHHNGIILQGKKIESFHDHSGSGKIEKIAEQMRSTNIILVSDAGSPYISDPSFPIVSKAKELNLPIRTIPGVCAPIAALELSGLNPSPFHFYSFIPRDKGKKAQFFEECSGVYGTHIFFEGVSRVEKTIDQLVDTFPNEEFCIAREITKLHESVHRFKASEWESLKKDVVYKGEFVILFTNSNKSSGVNQKALQLANQIIEEGAHPKKLSKLLAELTDQNSKEIYQKISRKPS